MTAKASIDFLELSEHKTMAINKNGGWKHNVHTNPMVYS
jgi:hypothetical protein